MAPQDQTPSSPRGSSSDKNEIRVGDDAKVGQVAAGQNITQTHIEHQVVYTTEPQMEKRGHEVPSLLLDLIFAVILCLVVAVVGNFITSYLALDAARVLLYVVSGGILLLIMTRYFIFARRKNSWRSIVISLTVLTILMVPVYLSFVRLLDRHTNYFLVDASAGMQPIFASVSPKLKLNARMVPDNTEVGLGVFGGAISGKTGCDDFEELTRPGPKPQVIPDLDEKVDLVMQLRPQGPGNLQGAILKVLPSLANRPGIQRITVITSGLDTSCGPLDRRAVEARAQELGIQYEIAILAIGDVNNQTKTQLEAFSTNKAFINADKPEDLPRKIEIILSRPPGSANLGYYGYYGYAP